MARRRGSALVFVLVAVGAGTPPAHAVKPYDVNGDGRQDLVVGLPSWLTDDGEEVGALVALGSKRGLIARPRVITRAALGIPGGNWEAGIGTSVASADFDGDGLADLAFGAPSLGEYEQQEYESRGAVSIAYGGRSFPGRTDLFREEKGDAPSFLGSYLVAGEVSRDGFGDLVLGPDDFDVIPGGEDGLSGEAAFMIPAPPGAERLGDVGRALALGDTTGNGQIELFEAAQGRDSEDGPPVAGNVAGVFDGADRARWVAEDQRGGPGSLALADVNGDGYGDLVTGVHHNHFRNEGKPIPGAVKIWWGGRDGLSRRPMTITQDSPGVPGKSEAGDVFGWSVSAGRLDSDRYADIVVGAPGEDELPGEEDAPARGRVTIIRGGPAGYSRKRNRSFGLETRGVPGGAKRGERSFGHWTSVLDLNGDSRLDLAVSNGALAFGGGGITIFRGTRRGLSLEDAKRVKYGRLGVGGGSGSASYARIGRPGSSG
ncbi:MAG: FG-GAP and VCBS repeat-containing protein [Thermoleophilaceae bacterium]